MSHGHDHGETVESLRDGLRGNHLAADKRDFTRVAANKAVIKGYLLLGILPVVLYRARVRREYLPIVSRQKERTIRTIRQTHVHRKTPNEAATVFVTRRHGCRHLYQIAVFATRPIIEIKFERFELFDAP